MLVRPTEGGVSVVVPCYNAQHFVAKAIESVIADAFEVIAVDDGSTDQTLSVLRSYQSQVTVVTGPNAGACHARNRGLAIASGAYVVFLDADDYLERGTLAGLAAALADQDADLAFAPLLIEESDGRRRAASGPRIDNLNTFLSDWLAGSYIPPCGILWRAAKLREIGGWDESLSKNQDGDVVLRAAQAGARLISSNVGAAVYRQHNGKDRISNSFSSHKLLDSLRVIRAAHDRALVDGPPDPKLERAFSSATHSLERLAAREGIRVARNEICSYRKAMGWPAAEGERLHVVASHWLGLARKERLSAWLRKWAIAKT